MSTWLSRQPVGLLFVLFLALFASLAVVAHVGLRRHLVDREDDASRMAGSLMGAVGGSFAVLAAFTIASAASSLGKVEADVAQEANAVARLSWSTNALGSSGAPARDALEAYVTATLDGEWRPLGRSEVQQTAAFARLAELEGTIRGALADAGPELGPAERTEVLGALDGVSGARRNRFVSTRPLQPALLTMLLMTGAVLVVNAVVLALPSERRTMVVLAGLVLVVGGSVALVLGLSAPFSGSFAAGKDPLLSVLDGLRANSFTLPGG